ncbi:MAG: hypothetical protein E7282_07770 [Lachnospiraceae bacterium]|nr:hypothetical protein [Lachnospiraceae bacterium]
MKKRVFNKANSTLDLIAQVDTFRIYLVFLWLLPVLLTAADAIERAIWNREFKLSAHEMFVFSSDYSKWGILSWILPFLLVFPTCFLMMDMNEQNTYAYLPKQFGKVRFTFLCAGLNIVITFLSVLLVCLADLLFCRILFATNGVNINGIRYGSAYWKNVGEGNAHIGEFFYLEHPWQYKILASVVFAAFCACLSLLFFAISLFIHTNAFVIFIAPSVCILFFYVAEYYGDYEFWAMYTLSITWEQSVGPAVALVALLILSALALMGVFYVRNQKHQRDVTGIYH